MPIAAIAPAEEKPMAKEEAPEEEEEIVSYALWAFLESIPTTLASATENANRALEPVSSFSRENLLLLPSSSCFMCFLWLSMGILKQLGRFTP
ncbi:hypothetical protein K1719_016334 [Acacia pycnantha]|nr:hypothetical protein K1719_016334 [Acacia pycnantha]